MIKKQIDYLIENWNIRILYFQDDTFTANRKLVNEICDYILEKGYQKRLEIMVSSRVDTLHPPTLKKMRTASVRWMGLGIESGNQEILQHMHKRITLEQIAKAYQMIREADIHIAGNFMLGHINETWQTAMDTIQIACRLDQDYASFAIAIPLPGTELFQYCQEKNIPLPSWNDFGSVNTPPIPLNKGLDAQALLKLREIATNSFFKRPMYLAKLLWRFRPLKVIKDFLTMYLAIKSEKRAKRM